MSLHGWSDVASCWSPGSHLTEQTPSLCWAAMGFCGGKAGWIFAVYVVGPSLRIWAHKKTTTSHSLYLTPLCCFKAAYRAKQLAKFFCNNHKALWGNKSLFTRGKTKQGWERHTHFFKTQPSPLSTSLLPDILYQAFYLFFIHFHNAFSWCDHYPERRLVNLQPFIIHFQLWVHIEHCCLGLICALAPISQLYFVVMIS